MIKHPTPRTDSNIATIKELTNIICTPIVRADFARELECEVIELKNDIELAAGELRVPIPEPGTDMARVMIANRIMRNERDKARNELNDMRDAIKEAISFLNIGSHGIAGFNMRAALNKLLPFIDK